LFEAMAEIKKVKIKQTVKVNDIIIKNLLNLGVNLIATRSTKF
jgi:CxxC motif-containing protein